MRQQVQRIVALLTAGFMVYKITVVVFANKVPGQPFSGFGAREWFVWLFDPHEFAFILIALIVEYGLLYFVTRRLSIMTLAAWSGLLGAYIACLLFPFDLLATIDELPDRYWPPGLVGAALEILIFFGIVPSAFAVALLWFRQSAKPETTA